MNIYEVIDNAQFIVDSEGNRKSVMLDYRLWEKLLLFFENAGRTAVPKQTAKKKTKSFLRTARSNSDNLTDSKQANKQKDDSLLKLAGVFGSEITDVSERHDEYIGEALKKQ